jgi:hypothetical protein
MALDTSDLPTEETAFNLAINVNFGGTANQWPVAVGNGASVSATATEDFEDAILIDLTLNDERGMKQELVAWAKAVASMSIRASMQC